MRIDLNRCFPLLGGLLMTSCATHHLDLGKSIGQWEKEPGISDSIIHTFYLVGDAGNLDHEQVYKNSLILKEKLKFAPENSSLLFLGDNIYPKGMPKKVDKERILAEKKLDNQLSLADDFKGQVIFIPGNHDWYNQGIKGLKRQQDYIQEKTNNPKSFAPQNGCAIESRKINKDLALIVVDTQWVLSDWDDNPGINENCTIKTREDFYTELEDQLNKHQNRTIVLALHHPVLTNGSHGGFLSGEKQLYPFESNFPLPLLGSFINLIRVTSGVSNQDITNVSYRTMANRIKALIEGRQNVVVVSGHDHNLQLINHNIKQIISGAGSKTEAAKAVGDKDFSYGNNGYAELRITKSGNAEVAFYSLEDNRSQLLYRTTLLGDEKKYNQQYPNQFSEYTTSQVYDSAATKKSALFKFLFGRHYREYYSKPILAKNLSLDTLYGGVKPNRAGGGHQTRSLRLETKDGKEYAMRALKKSGARFLQAVAFKEQFVEDVFEGSFADRFLLDFYTTSHPYTPLAVGEMSDKLGIPHTNPQLFYIPKQKWLKSFNENFGDELYYVEERPTETEENPNKILGTDEVLHQLVKDEKYIVDEKAWIKARLFDMLIGDWDRHHDQWKFEERKENNKVIYSPIPKDRDQAFSRYDGFLLWFVMKMPALRHMKSFKEKYKNVKWFNREPYTLDLAFTKNSSLEDWMEMAKFIQDNLTEQDIRKAFKNLPAEVQDDTTEEIIKALLIRKNDLANYAKKYYEVLSRKVLLTGTNKKDKFEIIRLPNQTTEIKIWRLKKSGEELISSKQYHKSRTKEIWIYGLSDDDVFEVKGEEKNNIKVRLIGGWDEDTYHIENGSQVHIYDHHSKKNQLGKTGSATVTLTDDYEVNQYHYDRPKYNVFMAMLNGGYNPDDEVMLGLNWVYTVNNFAQNPFSQKHMLKTSYFTGTDGYELAYQGVFPPLTGNWFYQLDARITNSHYIRNFYGIGNETINQEKILGKRHYNVRGKEFGVSPSVNWKKDAATFSARLLYEGLKVEKTEGRLIAQGLLDDEVFGTKHFGGVELDFVYENYNKNAAPTLGMRLDVKSGWKVNLEDKQKRLPYLETGLGFIHYLTENQKMVLSTYAKAKWLFSNDYEFYQMPTLGGKDLRGFRFNRFYGKNSFVQSTDLRYDLGGFKNTFLPISYSVFAGFDYGRVWNPNESSKQWHTSYGGGIGFNLLEIISFNASYFKSKEGGRFVLGLNGVF